MVVFEKYKFKISGVASISISFKASRTGNLFLTASDKNEANLICSVFIASGSWRNRFSSPFNKPTISLSKRIGPVNLIHFKQKSTFPEGCVFLTLGRLLGDKGFREYATAAALVKKRYPDVVFKLVGPNDPSPDSIPVNEVQSWHEKGWIEYCGATNDVRPFLEECSVFVLASYHEGMPRTVLEAMSVGRPILTTDVPGCRETVDPGENGFLVPKADAEALAERMIWFIENSDKWKTMGIKSREIAEERFDVRKVNDKLISILGLKG